MVYKASLLLFALFAAVAGQTCSSENECPKKCVDLYPECAGWKSLNYCVRDPNNLQRAADMEKNCPASCGYCNPTCDDYDCPEDCAARAAADECKKDDTAPIMQTRCKKTCGQCKCSNKHLGCPWLADLCTSTNVQERTYAHFWCPQTCQTCTTYHECDIRDVSGKCPRDWKYNPATDKCYFLTGYTDTFANMEAQCQLIGGTGNGHVTSVNDEAENTFLTQYLPPPNRDLGKGWGDMCCFYIGLRRANQGPTGWDIGLSSWVDGSTSIFRKWDPYAGPQPNFGVQPNKNPGENNAQLCYPGSPNQYVPTQSHVTAGTWHDQVEGPEYNLPAFCRRNVCS